MLKGLAAAFAVYPQIPTPAAELQLITSLKINYYWQNYCFDISLLAERFRRWSIQHNAIVLDP